MVIASVIRENSLSPKLCPRKLEHLDLDRMAGAANIRSMLCQLRSANSGKKLNIVP